MKSKTAEWLACIFELREKLLANGVDWDPWTPDPVVRLRPDVRVRPELAAEMRDVLQSGLELVAPPDVPEEGVAPAEVSVVEPGEPWPLQRLLPLFTNPGLPGSFLEPSPHPSEGSQPDGEKSNPVVVVRSLQALVLACEQGALTLN